VNGLVSGDNARALFLKSGLPTPILAQVYFSFLQHKKQHFLSKNFYMKLGVEPSTIVVQ
jgi:hypothetical protein